MRDVCVTSSLFKDSSVVKFRDLGRTDCWHIPYSSGNPWDLKDNSSLLHIGFYLCSLDYEVKMSAVKNDYYGQKL